MRSSGVSVPARQEIDEAAFADLFERYKRLVYKTAYLMLGDRAEADDALQEVFVRVYTSLASFDPHKGAMTTWLYRITINYCLGHHRKRRIPTEPLDDALSTSSDESPESRLAHSTERQELRRAIFQLTDKQRAVIVLRYYWDLPYAEVAEILAIPIGTVKSRLDLALKNLALKLAGSQTEYPKDSPLALECDV